VNFRTLDSTGIRTDSRANHRLDDSSDEIVSAQTEFDNLAAALKVSRRADSLSDTPTQGTRGPRRRITAESICLSALRIIDNEGASALTVRRLAMDMNISTRTLYKRVPNRHGNHSRCY